MRDLSKYKELYKIASELEPAEAMALVDEAESYEERKFYVGIANMVLQRKQEELIENNVF